MKTALAILSVVAPSLSSLAQGTIQLSNSSLPGPTPGTTYEAMIKLGPSLGGGLPGDRGAGYYTAGLYLEGSMTPLVTTTFFSGTGLDAQYNYIFASEPQIAVPGIAPGSTGRFFVAAWDTAAGSYENAAATWTLGRGLSSVFTSRPLGGPNPTPGELPFTTPVTTFQGFTMHAFVPEPSAVSLSLAGLFALILRRRKIRSP